MRNVWSAIANKVSVIKLPLLETVLAEDLEQRLKGILKFATVSGCRDNVLWTASRCRITDAAID